MDFKNELQQKEMQINTMEMNQLIWMRWIELYQNGIKIEEYFKKNQIKNIAIYGMADLGIALYRELKDTDVVVCYGIDRVRQKCEYEVEIVTPNHVENVMDMIVITAVSHFQSIYNDLNTRLEGKIPIVGMDEVIIDLLIGEDENEMEKSWA